MSAAVCSLGSLLRRPALCAIVIGASALTGCAAYQHRIIEPAEAAGVVPDAGRAFVMEPLEYEAYEDGGRLALRVYNPDVMPITLLGERSYLVDPQGETRAIGAGTIAPGSHITLFLPPQVDRVRTGPRFGVGVGVGTGYRSGFVGGGVYRDPWAYPTYTYESVPIWRWVTGVIQLQLTYERGEERFIHELAIERERVN